MSFHLCFNGTSFPVGDIIPPKILIVSQRDPQDMTEWQIEEQEGNEENVARWRQSRTKFELHVLKGNLDPYVPQEFREVRVEVKKHSQESSEQDEEDQDPFQTVNTRIIDPQFGIDNAFEKNPTPSDQAEHRGNVSES